MVGSVKMSHARYERIENEVKFSEMKGKELIEMAKGLYDFICLGCEWHHLELGR